MEKIKIKISEPLPAFAAATAVCAVGSAALPRRRVQHSHRQQSNAGARGRGRAAHRAIAAAHRATAALLRPAAFHRFAVVHTLGAATLLPPAAPAAALRLQRTPSGTSPAHHKLSRPRPSSARPPHAPSAQPHGRLHFTSRSGGQRRWIARQHYARLGPSPAGDAAGATLCAVQQHERVCGVTSSPPLLLLFLSLAAAWPRGGFSGQLSITHRFSAFPTLLPPPLSLLSLF